MEEIAFRKCSRCGYVHENTRFKREHYICNKCGTYNTMTFSDRLDSIVDAGTFEELNEELAFQDPIIFPGYEEKYEKAAELTGLKEAIVTGYGEIYGIGTMLGIMDSRFIMASMGISVGTKIACLFEEAQKQKLPVIIFSTSGGARMQEGIYSLMQMAKTAAAAQEFSEAGGYYISVLTNPTTGGVSASFAFLGDTILAEPNALIGFAGKRVIEQTIKEQLPEGFQTSEYLLEHGFLDAIVPREDLKALLFRLLKYHATPKVDACAY